MRIPKRLLAATAAACVVWSIPAAAVAHEGSPDYLSTINRVSPSVMGLRVQVVERDEGLRLVNRTGHTIVVPGYENEPYLRVLANGLVEINKRSPARYINADRYGKSPIPETADPKAAPQWIAIGHDGVVRWHDHRIHWMAKTVPAQVKDEDQKSKVFDWAVPILVGAEHVVVHGTLYWAPDEDSAAGGGTPIVPIVAGIGGAAALVALGIVLLRRRGAREGPSSKAESW
jgi:hypothetical protein